MYWPDVKDLDDFYNTTLGRLVCRRIRGTFREFWPDLHDNSQEIDILGIGYATPYLKPYLNSSRNSRGHIRPLALMPARQGVTFWPKNSKNFKNMAFLGDESALPFANASIDRVIIAHALEYTDQQISMLREVWRILAPGGKIVVIVPNRLSIWARVEKTPFGHGHPFTQNQLEDLLNETMFIPTKTDMVLFMPPSQSRIILRGAELWRKIGKKLFKPLGGALIIEAEKRVYATTSGLKGTKSPIFAPVTSVNN